MILVEPALVQVHVPKIVVQDIVWALSDDADCVPDHDDNNTAEAYKYQYHVLHTSTRGAKYVFVRTVQVLHCTKHVMKKRSKVQVSFQFGLFTDEVESHLFINVRLIVSQMRTLRSMFFTS